MLSYGGATGKDIALQWSSVSSPTYFQGWRGNMDSQMIVKENSDNYSTDEEYIFTLTDKKVLIQKILGA